MRRHEQRSILKDFTETFATEGSITMQMGSLQDDDDWFGLKSLTICKKATAYFLVWLLYTLEPPLT